MAPAIAEHSRQSLTNDPNRRKIMNKSNHVSTHNEQTSLNAPASVAMSDAEFDSVTGGAAGQRIPVETTGAASGAGGSNDAQHRAVRRGNRGGDVPHQTHPP
jgi:hypothetical protein